MLKEAIEKIVSLARPEVVEIGGRTFATNSLSVVKDPKPAALKATTLTALVDYIKSGIDINIDLEPCGELADKLVLERQMFIHIVSPREVELYSSLRADQDREYFLECNAMLPEVTYERFMTTDKFNIMLQSCFVPNDDRALLLKVTGNIVENEVRTMVDDGVSQTAAIKTGIANVDQVIIPNPAELIPYRTFPEINQVESLFIFRMQQGQKGPEAAIFEADGGAWRNQTMQRIKSWLEEELEDVANFQIIS